MKNTPIHIYALATANPSWYVTQEEAYQHFTSLFDLKESDQDLYERLLKDSDIQGRYVAMDSPEEIAETNPDRLNQRYLKHARSIAAQAARKALMQAGLETNAIGGLVVNSCTGYVCPGLSSYLLEDLGLPRDIHYLDLMGMGCGGALPNLFAASGMVANRPERPVLSIAVEICTATLFMGSDPGLIVSNAIFGDGASALILGTGLKGGLSTSVTLVDYESGLYPRYRSDLQYRMEDHRLRNVLSLRVPVIGARSIHDVVGRLLERNHLTQDDINSWAVHPGGTAVLDALIKKFGFPPDTLQHSFKIFREYGNMSSPSVMYVLQSILNHQPPRAGSYGLLLAFGAGFSAFAMLVKFQ